MSILCKARETWVIGYAAPTCTLRRNSTTYTSIMLQCMVLSQRRICFSVLHDDDVHDHDAITIYNDVDDHVDDDVR